MEELVDEKVTFFLGCPADKIVVSDSKSSENDFVLTSSDGLQVKVRKDKLKAQSEVLATMFEENNGICAELDGETLRAMLAYLYGRTELENERLLQKLLIAAHKYKIKSLEEDCARQLTANLQNENLFYAADLLFLAKSLAIEAMQQQILTFFFHEYTSSKFDEDALTAISPDRITPEPERVESTDEDTALA